jgi:Clr5 domain
MNHAAQAASTSGSASSPPLEKDPQLPLPADWDRMKDIIHSLYIGKKLPLKDVRAKMERDHSFKAT